MGTLDDAGRLWLLGRASAMLAGGVVPAVVEEPVAALDGVKAAALVSVPDQSGPRLCVVVEPALDAIPLVVRERVASLASARGWRLDRVVIVRRLPRDPRSGKIDYRQLLALVGDH